MLRKQNCVQGSLCYFQLKSIDWKAHFNVRFEDDAVRKTKIGGNGR